LQVEVLYIRDNHVQCSILNLFLPEKLNDFDLAATILMHPCRDNDFRLIVYFNCAYDLRSINQ